MTPDNHVKDNDTPEETQPWYKEGLRFECQRCGRCCRGGPGVVWVNMKEVEKISAFLGITKDVFARYYLRRVNERLSFIEYGNGNCIMYDSGCKVYAVRPCQCSTFPFWKSNLEDSSEWEKLKNTCPGIGKGSLHSLKEIQDNLQKYEGRFG